MTDIHPGIKILTLTPKEEHKLNKQSQDFPNHYGCLLLCAVLPFERYQEWDEKRLTKLLKKVRLASQPQRAPYICDKDVHRLIGCACVSKAHTMLSHIFNYLLFIFRP